MSSDSDEVWDEFQWERFLQQQDRKTEKYLELLEKYIDDPKRDQRIAEEMGWSHIGMTEEGEPMDLGVDWDVDDDEEAIEASDEEDEDLADDEEELDDSEDDEEIDDDDDEEEDDDVEEGEDEDGVLESLLSFQEHPVYQDSFAMMIWLDDLFEAHEELREHPAMLRVASCGSLCTAKLAAALSDDESDELGMTIAYLKRALWAINGCLEGCRELVEARLGPDEMRQTLEERIFRVRNGIVSVVGECRAEWRRRYGSP